MLFEETRLNDKTSYGFLGGPRFKERIHERPNGAERRNRMWSMPRFEYRAPYRKVTPEVYREVYNAFLALDGSHVGFRFKDFSDFQSWTPQPLGTAAGGEEEMQLVKLYQFGSRIRTREILKPVAGTVVVYANGTPISSTTDPATGLTTFTATAGQAITADFEFDVPVRFDMDYLPWSFEQWETMTADLMLLELKRHVLEVV